MGMALDRDEIREIVIEALNADSNDAEFSALCQIAEMVGVEHNGDTDEWEVVKGE